MVEELVKPGDGDMGGSLWNDPPSGVNKYEFISKEREIEGADKDALKLVLAYIDDPDAKVKMWFKYSTETGLRKLLDVIIRSNVWPKMVKKYKYKSDPTEGLPPSMLRDEKFQQRLVLELEGLHLMCDVDVIAKKEGEKYSTVNVIKVEAVNSSRTGAKKAASSDVQTGTGEEQESGW
jgi:hypothetical protein